MDKMKMLVMVSLLAALLSGCAATGGNGQSLLPAPPFSVTLLKGGEATLDQLRGGRPMVLNVGATWCPHCLHELPTFRKVYDRYKDRAALLMVFEKSPKEDALSLVLKEGLEFPIALDPEGTVAKAYGVKGMPVTFFIDREGRLADYYFGAIEEDELADKIEGLLK